MGSGDEWRLEARSRFPIVSPNGRWIAFSSTEETMLLINAVDGSQQLLPGTGVSIGAWSPNSRYLAYAPHGETLLVYDIAEACLASFPEETTKGISEITNIVWSPSGRFIAFACCFMMEENEEARQGEIKRISVASGQIETTGETYASIGGGTPELCWINGNDEEIVLGNSAIRPKDNCSFVTNTVQTFSSDGMRQATLQPAAANDTSWQGSSLLTVENAATSNTVLLWQRQLEENIKIVAWSSNSQYLFLDDFQADSPIWRIKADGSGEPEILIENGFLLFLTPQP
jgi:WD40 repeat protein